ncbi:MULTISPECIES: glycosyltransferase family 2 protein [Aeromonas]|uniref:Family 2 glycosyl transferase n=1 Tax=Aeromonas veronii TaxID=654 RepID=A0AAX2UN61_AERVE|nr:MULTISPECIES: glycosyltransferase family 2 protein [Aeromonas]ATL93195.1 family 2 glycosyl transferase [Aeromonas sp. CU5]TND50693.1 family 2 glycosyl transferase [Aeromonas veronii]
MKKIDIALATYNGSPFLSEQLDSILNQTHTEILVLCSDDGSKDDTVLKVDNYATFDTRIHVCNTRRVGGTVLNFEKALEATQSEYIMLSDQDDVWLPHKIDSMLNFIIEKENELGSESPILCFSDLTLVNENLNVIADSFYKANNYDPLNNTQEGFLLWRSTVYGCSCIFNKACLKMALPFPKYIPMHDHWLALIAAKHGAVFYYDQPTILYRQHASNVVGGAAFNKPHFYKLKNAKKLIAGIKRAHQGSLVMREVMGDKRGKIKFFFDCIWPYFHEKKLFSFIFTFFHFWGK